MQQEDTEDQERIKEVISFKKDKHRVEIRKKNIQTVLKNKRINHFETTNLNGSQQQQNENDMRSISQMIPNLNNHNNEQQQDKQFFQADDGNQITILSYITAINQICDSNDYVAQNDKISRCLGILNTYILYAVRSTDSDMQEQQILQFMRSGGCECILQFFKEKYDQVPLFQVQSLGMIGNIYSLSNNHIQSFLVQCGIVGNLMSFLNRLTNYIINSQTQQQSAADMRNELLSEMFRTLANMAGESYEYRTELVHKNLIRYLTGDGFNQLCNNLNRSIVSNIIFLIKNMLCCSPTLGEEVTEQFIPILSAFFLNTDLSLESLQDGVLAVKSYARFGNTIARAKMISQAEVFEKIHSLINPNINNDFSIIHYAMSTLKDYMRYQNRQAEYVFNMSGDQIFKNLEYYLRGQIVLQNVKQTEINKMVVDLQNCAIEILHLYVLCEDNLYFSFIYENGYQLIELIMNIAIYSPNDKLNYRAKEFLFLCVSRANYEQQQSLVKLNILQVILDSIQEDEVSFIDKALRALLQLLSVAESQIGQSPDFAEKNYVKELSERQFQFRQVLESIQSHPNNDIYGSVNDILESFYQN